MRTPRPGPPWGYLVSLRVQLDIGGGADQPDTGLSMDDALKYRGPGRFCRGEGFRIDAASCGDREDFDGDLSGSVSYKEAPGRGSLFFDVFSTDGTLFCEFYDRETGKLGFVVTLEDLLQLLRSACGAIGRELPSPGDDVA